MTPPTLPPALPARHEPPQPTTAQGTSPPMPCDVFCTVVRHPGLARPQGSVVSLAG